MNGNRGTEYKTWTRLKNKLKGLDSTGGEWEGELYDR